MDITYNADQKIVAQKATQQLNALLAEHSSMPVLLLLSGGSAMTLVEDIDPMMLSKNTVISMVDERIGSDDNSNYYQLEQSPFYRVATERGAQFFDVRAKDGEDEKEAAARLQKMFRMLLQMMPTCTIITTMGVGPDGHTAGIMPYPEDEEFFTETFDTKDRWIVGYDAGTKNQYSQRVTVSLSFLRDHVDYAIIYACGEDKKSALHAVNAREGTLSATPARILNELKKATLFTNVDGVSEKSV